MKNSFKIFLLILIGLILLNIIHCGKEDENPYYPINYEYGTFPAKLTNWIDVNTKYNDYNIDIPSMENEFRFYLSSDRNKYGNNFDIITFHAVVQFNKNDGHFIIFGEEYGKCIDSINTEGNEFGPLVINFNQSLWKTDEAYSKYMWEIDEKLWNTTDSNCVLFYSSDSSQSGELNIWFAHIKNHYNMFRCKDYGPIYRYKSNLLNSNNDDGYITFGPNNTLYFCSNRNGYFDIFYIDIPIVLNKDNFTSFFQDTSYKNLITELSTVNSNYDDKCPYIFDSTMVFVSNRDGLKSGFDVWKSEFDGNQWSSPVKMGSNINSSYNEYRPILLGSQDYTNRLLIFSSNRPGGKGGFDLYYIGVE